MRTRLLRKSSLLAAALVSLTCLPAPAWAARLSFEDLVANLKSPSAKTRQEAAAELGKSRRREAIAPLSPLVADPDVKVRLEVVRALNALRDLQAVPAFVASMGDGDPKIRQEAMLALVEVYADRDRTPQTSRYLDTLSDEWDRASVPPYTSVDPAVYQALSEALRDSQRDIREQAALTLGILNGSSAIQELVAALSDPDAGVRGAAASAIGKVGTEEDGRALIPLLADPAYGARTRALRAIGVLRVKEAGPALRQLYEANQRREYGLLVLESLSRIADPAQEDFLRGLAQDPQAEKRRFAIEGLGRIGNGALLTAMKKDYQRETSADLRLAYGFAITQLGDRSFIDSVVLGLASRNSVRCRRYLMEMGSGVLPELYPYLNDPAEDVRAELSDIIAALGDASAIAQLQPLIGDPSRKVSDRANRAVERLKRSAGSAQ